MLFTRNPSVNSLILTDNRKPYRQNKESNKKESVMWCKLKIFLVWYASDYLYMLSKQNWLSNNSVLSNFPRRISMIITNPRIASSGLPHVPQILFLTVITLLLEDSLRIIFGGLIDVFTLTLIEFSPTCLCFSPTEENFILVRIVTGYAEILPINIRASVSTSGHCLVRLRPAIYFRWAFHRLKWTNQIKVYLFNLLHDNHILLC